MSPSPQRQLQRIIYIHPRGIHFILLFFNMVDWQSPAEIAHDGGMLPVPKSTKIFNKTMPHQRLFLDLCMRYWGCICTRFRFPFPWCADSQRTSWEFVTSLDFDWQFISGVKKFRWPLVCLLSLFSKKEAHFSLPDFLLCWSIFSTLRIDWNVRKIEPTMHHVASLIPP